MIRSRYGNNHIKQNPQNYKGNVDVTDKTGVIPLRDQLKAFNESGVLLHSSRALQYDYDGTLEKPEEFDRMFNRLTACRDLTDLDELAKISANVTKAQKMLTEQKKFDEKKTVEEEKFKAAWNEFIKKYPQYVNSSDGEMKKE